MSMTVEALRDAAAVGTIDTVVVAFTDHYGRLVGKRFDARFFCETVIDEGTHACDYLLTVDMEMEPTSGYDFASWEQGYGDVHLVPDLTTLRRAAWTDGAAIVLCDVLTNDATKDPPNDPANDPANDAADGLVTVAPRTILRRQVDRLAARGLTAMAASELEFFVYDDSYRDAHAKGYRDLRPAGWYVEDYHLLPGARVEPYLRTARVALAESGIAVEGSKGEWGRGQQELNIRYADVLEMADRHTLMKHAMKELADAMGVAVTFMAKPSADGAGSSGHIHLSLWDDAAGTNVFAAGRGESATFRHFLAGWLAHAADFMICYAPTVNSYKRYVDGSWAPTRLAWSRDNRTAGFRVVGAGPSLRIECRVPGADCNPYLAYAATLASGLAGMERELEPPAELAGDVYHAAALPRVAVSLEHAMASFRDSIVTRAAFGDAVVDHYVRMCEVEVAAYHAAVTDWERSRYFERI
jgi:glutamine synthetase